MPEEKVNVNENVTETAAENVTESATETAAENVAETETENVNDMTLDKATGTAIILGALIGGMIIVLSALRTRNLNREKGKTRYHIEKVGTFDYDREDRRKVRKSIRKYSKKAGRARTRRGVRKANLRFQNAIAGVQTRSEKLSDIKIDAVEKLYAGGFVRGKMKYGADFSISDFVERIKEAPDAETLKKILKEIQ